MALKVAVIGATGIVGREILSEGLGLDTWMGAFVRALADRFREVEARLTKAEKELAKR